MSELTLNPEKIPGHVAIIMDGNGRWAEKRSHSRIWGHIRGTSKVKAIVRYCDEIGIKTLTLYAFSSENWQRPDLEVKILMKLLKKYLQSERNELMEKNVKLTTIGDVSKLPPSVFEELSTTKNLTENNTGLILNFAFSYGGRQEIIRATKEISRLCLQNKLTTEDIDDKLFSNYLWTSHLKDPDLLIRTSGEYRISNFLLWQCAYTELYVTDVLWPDFTVDEFKLALLNYQNRSRRFGKTKAQIMGESHGAK